MAANDVLMGNGVIRVTAKVLSEDLQRFKREWRTGLQQALQNLDINIPIITDQQATQQGQQAGQNMAQGAGQSFQQQAPQITAPVGQQGQQQGQSFGQNMLRGIAAAGIVAGVTKLFASGMNEAIQLNSASGNLQASLGLSAEDAKKHANEISKIYGEAYGGSIEEVETATASVISSIDGMRTASPEAVGEVTRSILALSDAMGIDAARSSQVLGQMVRTGLVSDVQEGTDLLFASLQKVPVNLREDILDAADEYGPFFAQLGISGEEAFNMLVKGSEQGMYGIDKTGDALKELTIRATDMSTASQDAFTALGLDAQSMAERFLAGGDTAKGALNEMVTALLSIQDPALQANTAIALFGTPVEDLGVDKIPGFLAALQTTNNVLGDTAGKADEAKKALGDTFASQLESVKRQFNQTLGEIALPLLEAMLPVLQGISAFLTENRDLIAAIGGPLLIVAGVIATIVAAMSAYSTIAAVLAPVIAAVGAAQFTWNAALLMNPLTLWILAITAIIGLIALLIFNFDHVKNFMLDAVNVIVDAFEWLGDRFSDIFGGIGEFFSNGDFNLAITGGGGFGIPMFANGGLVTKPTLGMIGEAGQNEIIMNEGLYNRQADEMITMIQNVNNGESGTHFGGGFQQNNTFNEVSDPLKIEAILTTRAKQIGY